VLVSGGVGREGIDESRVMRDYLISIGLAPDAILRDSLGITTFATAMNARRIMDGRRLRSAVVVSQYFHIARAEVACRRAGIDVRGGSAPWYFEARDLWSIPREVIGLISYSLRQVPATR
jgi:vancomycin permeability regulator SanA